MSSYESQNCVECSGHLCLNCYYQQQCDISRDNYLNIANKMAHKQGGAKLVLLPGMRRYHDCEVYCHTLLDISVVSRLNHWLKLSHFYGGYSVDWDIIDLTKQRVFVSGQFVWVLLNFIAQQETVWGRTSVGEIIPLWHLGSNWVKNATIILLGLEVKCSKCCH